MVVIDNVKPLVGGVELGKTSAFAINTKPNIGFADSERIDSAVVSRTLYAGQTMGLLWAITYPTNITIS